MKKIQLFLILACLAACDAGESQDRAGGDSPSLAGGRPGVQPVALGDGGSGHGYEGPLLSFNHLWTGDVAGRGPLYQMLVADREQAQAMALALAEERNRSAAQPARHRYEKRWQVFGKNERLMSLGATIVHFKGRPPEETSYDSILWDRKAHRKLALDDVVTNAASFEAAVGPRLCATLKLERSRGPDAGKLPANAPCPPPSHTLMAFADGSGEGVFDTLRIMIPRGEPPLPSEKHYVLDLPLDQRALALVKPDYRSSFELYSP